MRDQTAATIGVMATQHWHDVLFSQGFGTRRVCAGVVQQGLLRHAGEVVTDGFDEVDPTGLHFSVPAVSWQ